MDEFYEVVNKLPDWLSKPLSNISAEEAQKIHEIRLKAGALPTVTRAGCQVTCSSLLDVTAEENAHQLQQDVCEKHLCTTWIPSIKSISTLNKKPQIKTTLCQIPRQAIVHQDIFLADDSLITLLETPLTQEQLEEIFFYLCEGSVHSHEDELKMGFFTMEGGHRVGVGGKYIPDSSTLLKNVHRGQPTWILQQILSLNIRIARHKTIEIPQQLAALLQKRFTGIVLLGEPDSGKTTMLRNLAIRLTEYNRTVVVIDERNELCINGVDAIVGMEKSCALQFALRTLSPSVIVLDELGTNEELAALEQGFFSGVDFIATLHADSFAEAELKPQFCYLRTHGLITSACLLQGRNTPGCIQEIKFYP